MINVDTNKICHEKYWRTVYTSMNLKISTETISFLKSLDQNRTYKENYRGQDEVKKRIQSGNNKIKKMMEQQKKMRNGV